MASTLARAPVAALIALALVATACEPPRTIVTPTAPPVIAARSADPDGELRLPIASDPETIDPQKASFPNEIAQVLLAFEPLLRFDPQTLRPVPGAAREPPTVSADGLVYTVFLRDGLAYPDGRRVTAADFAFGFRRLCDPGAGEYAFVAFVIAGCEPLRRGTAAELGVRVMDERTLEFRLGEPAAYFPATLALWVAVPVREDLVRAKGDRWTEPGSYLGNGHYVLKEWKRGERLVYERNDRHPQRAGLKRVVLRALPEPAARRAAYQIGELDAYDLTADDRVIVEGGPASPDRLLRGAGSCTFAVGFNTSRPPFDDPRLRLAFAKALDREKFRKDVQSRLGDANTSFIPTGLPGHDRDDETQKFDRNAARKLVAESTYAVGIPDTRFTYASNPVTKARVEWIVEQWRTNLFLDVFPDPVSRGGGRQLGAERPQLFALTWCGDYPDPQAWLTAVFHSATSPNRETMGYRSAEFDRLARAADTERDEARRASLYRDAQRLLTREAPAAFLWSSRAYWLVKPHVGGLAPGAADPILGPLAAGELFVTARR